MTCFAQVLCLLVKVFLEYVLFAVLWASFAVLVFWVFSRLRVLRQIDARVRELEEAVFGPVDGLNDCSVCDPQPEGATEEQSDEPVDAADESAGAAGKPQD